MPLIEILHSNPDAVSRFTIEQLMITAGDGDLSDHSECSWELREYLSQVISCSLNAYISHCLSRSFANSGFVLQDIVNELGRRMDCHVENGLYRGRSNAVGFDGLWQTPEGRSIVVEVKTSDVFRINLEVIAGYRDALIHQGRISETSSILIIVGRQDTGEIEDQIRGSRYAWNTRLISTAALADLAALMEGASDGEAASRFRGLLEPFDHIRLDGIIEAVASSAAGAPFKRPAPISVEEKRRAAIRKMRRRIARVIANREKHESYPLGSIEN